MRNCLILGLFFVLYLSGIVSFAEDTVVPADNDTPLLVMLFDQNCHVWCAQVRPIMKELQQEYQGRVRYAELDTTQKVMKETMKQAKQLEINGYIPDAMGNVPEVLVFKRHGAKMTGEFAGVKDKKFYKAAIEKALAEK